jgi:hypothetical protein
MMIVEMTYVQDTVESLILSERRKLNSGNVSTGIWFRRTHENTPVIGLCSQSRIKQSNGRIIGKGIAHLNSISCLPYIFGLNSHGPINIAVYVITIEIRF